MKIKEIIERDCCETQDLKQYKGTIESSDPTYVSVLNHETKFCIHCGQLWIPKYSFDGQETVPILTKMKVVL